MTTIRRLVALALVASTTGAACTTAERSHAVSAEEGLRWVTSFLRGVGTAGDRIGPLYRTLDEVLPNVHYLYPDGRNRTYTQLAVLGRFTGVEKGKGFTVQGDDAPDGTPVDFDNDKARWRTVHAHVEVDRAIGGGDAPKRLTVAFPLYERDKVAEFDAGLRALGTVVLFLQSETALNDYDESLYIVMDHTFVATVGNDAGRSLSLPFLESAESSRLLGSGAGRTLPGLDQAARTPRSIALLPGAGSDAPVRP